MTGRTNGNHFLQGYDLMDLLNRAYYIGATGLHLPAEQTRGRSAVHYRWLSAIQSEVPGWEVWDDENYEWVRVDYTYPLGTKGMSLTRRSA